MVLATAPIGMVTRRGCSGCPIAVRDSASLTGPAGIAAASFCRRSAGASRDVFASTAATRGSRVCEISDMHLSYGTHVVSATGGPDATSLLPLH